MLIFNDFNALFNAYGGVNTSPHSVFDVPVCNGLADISEFLRVCNGFPENEPDMTSDIND